MRPTAYSFSSRKRLGGVLAALLLLVNSLPSLACLWDNDTLEQEARGLPDVVQVTTGRFARNPSLYYEMRLTRVTSELAHDPARLADYDDAGVACDRLHHDDAALQWMARKRAQLQRLSGGKIPARGEFREQWYRYYANVGTFRAHLWLAQPANKRTLIELAQARNEIARALEINPNAHFGRERVQLGVMDWMLQNAHFSMLPDSKRADVTKPLRLSEFLHQGRDLEWEYGQADAKMVQGLCGLIVLGNAWESVDIFETLSQVVGRKQNLRWFAEKRAQELIAQGHYSLLPGSPKDNRLVKEFDLDGVRISHPAILGNLEREWPRLSAEAENWQRQRTGYMMARLQSGRHPDTDPNFWKEYHESPPPSLELSRWERFRVYMNTPEGWFRLFLVVLLSLGVVFAISVNVALSWWRKRRITGHTPA